MSGYAGLVEVVFAVLVLGWGVYELRSVRRDIRRAAEDELKEPPA